MEFEVSQRQLPVFWGCYVLAMHNSRSIYVSFPIHWSGNRAANDNVNQISQFGSIHYEPDNVIPSTTRRRGNYDIQILYIGSIYPSSVSISLWNSGAFSSEETLSSDGSRSFMPYDFQNLATEVLFGV